MRSQVGDTGMIVQDDRLQTQSELPVEVAHDLDPGHGIDTQILEAGVFIQASGFGMQYLPTYGGIWQIF